MSGVISGFETVGVTLASNPTTIAGTISVSTGNAVTGLAGPVWTLDNNGLVESSKGGGAAFYGQAVVANAAGAIIQGNYQGLYAVQAANIYNAGTLQAIAKFGVALEMVGGGQVTNAVGGVLTGGEVALDFQSNVTIFNAGSILDTGAFGAGLEGVGGLISNASSGVISGITGIDLFGAGTIINRGTIESTQTGGSAIIFGSGSGNLLIDEQGAKLIGGIGNFLANDTINFAGETITGLSFANGILTMSDAGVVLGTLALSGALTQGEFVLSGDGAGGTQITLGSETLTGNYTAGVALTALDTTIAAGATITSAYNGVSGAIGRAWSLQNDGTIAGGPGNYSAGVLLQQSGEITNAAGALIQGATGVVLSGGTVVNAGTIRSTLANGKAISIEGTNAATLLLEAGSSLGGSIYGLFTGDIIDLAGIIATGATFGQGVLTLTNAGAVVDTLALSGVFASSQFGLVSDNAGGTDITLGLSETLTGSYGSAVQLSAPSALITNTATVGGISAPSSRYVALVNAGLDTVSGSGTGLFFNDGQVTNTSSGSIIGYNGADMSGGHFVNAGNILGTGGNYSEGFELYGATLVNTGTIHGTAGLTEGSGAATNATGGTISGLTGVKLYGGSLDNSGSIIAGGGADLVSFKDTGLAQSGGTVTNETGGLIAGPTGVSLTSGLFTNNGTVAGIPGGYKANIYDTYYVPFVSEGMVLTGGVAINNAAALITGATGVVLNGGTLIDAGTIASAGTLATGNAISFGADAADLVLQSGADIIGEIAAFVPGDTIDFAGVSLTAASFANGVLTLENGGVVLSTLSLAGNFSPGEFSLTSDHAGGTELILGTRILTGSYAAGITLTATDTTIASTATINSPGLVVYGSGVRDWTLANSGLLENTLAGYFQGIQIKGSAYITNAASGTVSAAFTGMGLGGGYKGVDVTLVNAGTIRATAAYFNATGVAFGYHGAVTNLAGGLIEGKTAIAFAFPGSVLNQGTILATDGTSGVGINLGGGGTIVNQGLIATSAGNSAAAVRFGDNNYATALLVLDPGSTLVGAIAGFANNDVIDFASIGITGETFSNNVLTLTDGGVMLSTLAFTGGLQAQEFTLSSDGHGGTQVTLGSETLAGTYNAGILLTAARTTITNTGSAYASGSTPPRGVLTNASSTGESVYNYGSLTDTVGGLGVYSTGLRINNEAGGFIDGSGGIKLFSGPDGAINNAGTVIGTRYNGYGIDIVGGTLTNFAHGSILGAGAGVFMYNSSIANAGLIQGTSYTAIDFFGNYGNINNLAGGIISGTKGIKATYEGTVENAGTIESNLGASGTAIEFGDYLAHLTVEQGAVFIGSITAPGTYSHVLEFASGASAGVLAGIGESITGFNTIVFDAGAHWTLSGNTAGLAGGESIYGFGDGDTLNIDGFSITGASFVTGAGLELTGSGGTVTLDLQGSFQNTDFTVTSAGGIADNTLCFCAGTRIATASGEVLVEDLQIGDLIRTLHAGVQKIRWIGQQSYDGRFIAGNRAALPVCIQADAIGAGIPARDLWVSPGHAICIDGVLVHASYLVNGASIIQAEHVESVTYYHIELDSHEVIFAENCPAESFLGERFRGLFHNAASYRALYPEGCAPEHMCLPLLDSGFQLDAIQRRLAGRAGIAVLAASGALRGYVDQAGPDVCAGWAQDEATPEIPVCLDIFSAGRRIGRVLANFFRGDVRDAGYGSGYHGFSFQLPENTATPIEIRRSADGSKLTLTAAAISRAA